VPEQGGGDVQPHRGPCPSSVPVHRVGPNSFCKQSLELRLKPSQIVNGVPGRISFVFLNIGDHEVRIPFVSPCRVSTSGVLILNLNFSPAVPQTSGKGGGCGGGVSHPPGILEQSKTWTRLKSGETLTRSYKRTELFVFEEAPGAYEFWEEYHPPQLTAEQVVALEDAGIDFAREPLTSVHLRFKRTR
jgi:hypothetical protein